MDILTGTALSTYADEYDTYQFNILVDDGTKENSSANQRGYKQFTLDDINNDIIRSTSTLVGEGGSDAKIIKAKQEAEATLAYINNDAGVWDTLVRNNAHKILCVNAHLFKGEFAETMKKLKERDDSALCTAYLNGSGHFSPQDMEFYASALWAINHQGTPTLSADDMAKAEAEKEKAEKSDRKLSLVERVEKMNVEIEKNIRRRKSNTGATTDQAGSSIPTDTNITNKSQFIRSFNKLAMCKTLNDGLILATFNDMCIYPDRCHRAFLTTLYILKCNNRLIECTDSADNVKLMESCLDKNVTPLNTKLNKLQHEMFKICLPGRFRNDYVDNVSMIDEILGPILGVNALVIGSMYDIIFMTDLAALTTGRAIVHKLTSIRKKLHSEITENHLFTNYIIAHKEGLYNKPGNHDSESRAIIVIFAQIMCDFVYLELMRTIHNENLGDLICAPLDEIEAGDLIERPDPRNKNNLLIMRKTHDKTAIYCQGYWYITFNNRMYYSSNIRALLATILYC